MISAINTTSQKVGQLKPVVFQTSQSTSCNAQLQNSKLKLFFPGVYAVQWSVSGRAVNAGTMKFQVYNGENVIEGGEASAQVGESVLTTLTSAPVMIGHTDPKVPLTLTLQNLGGVAILTNAVLTARKVY